MLLHYVVYVVDVELSLQIAFWMEYDLLWKFSDAISFFCIKQFYFANFVISSLHCNVILFGEFSGFNLCV